MVVQLRYPSEPYYQFKGFHEHHHRDLLILYMVNNGVNITTQDETGGTIFHWAVQQNLYFLIGELLQIEGAIATIQYRDCDNESALDLAMKLKPFSPSDQIDRDGCEKIVQMFRECLNGSLDLPAGWERLRRGRCPCYIDTRLQSNPFYGKY